MSFLHDSTYSSAYYEHKDFFDQPSQLAVLQPQAAYGFPQVQMPPPASYHTTSLHLDPYHRQIQMPTPVFYYSSSAGTSMVSPRHLINLDPPATVPTSTAPVAPIAISTNSQDDTLRAESEDNTPPRKRVIGTKRGRPTKNPVWTFFRRLDEKSVQCNMCGRLVKSACATNMSKHIERHHHELGVVAQPSEGEFKYDQQGIACQWNSGYNVNALKMMGGFDSYPATGQSLPPGTTALPWNPERRISKRNRRTKHPVWELFRRTHDGQAQCQLCNVLVRSPCSSNFMGHLNRHHATHYADIYNRWLDGRNETENNQAPQPAPAPSSQLILTPPSEPPFEVKQEIP